MIALYDYTAKTEKTISFFRGNKFKVINRDNKEWWWVRDLVSNLEGYVPFNYVTEAAEESKNLEDEEQVSLSFSIYIWTVINSLISVGSLGIYPAMRHGYFYWSDLIRLELF